jgi:hypothetical protein
MGFYPTGRGFESLPGYQFKSPPFWWVFELVARKASRTPDGGTGAKTSPAEACLDAEVCVFALANHPYPGTELDLYVYYDIILLKFLCEVSLRRRS